MPSHLSWQVFASSRKTNFTFFAAFKDTEKTSAHPENGTEINCMNTRTNDDDHLVPRLTVVAFNES